MNNELITNLIDTHCHLDFPEFDHDRSEVIRRAKEEGLSYIINIGSSIEGSRRSIELAKEYDFIYASAGIHPHEADKVGEKQIDILKELAHNPKVVAIGEIGLDYYRNYSKTENQKSLFLDLIKLAKDLGLPVIIHNRQAEEDVLKILKQALPIRAVIHCFSADEKFLQDILELGFFVSYTCNITYKKAQNLRDLVKKTPLDRIFLETDAPYLPPEGFRGKRNEPFWVKRLADEIAKIKNTTAEEVAKITTQNAKSFFKLK